MTEAGNCMSTFSFSDGALQPAFYRVRQGEQRQGEEDGEGEKVQHPGNRQALDALSLASSMLSA